MRAQSQAAQAVAQQFRPVAEGNNQADPPGRLHGVEHERDDGLGVRPRRGWRTQPSLQGPQQTKQPGGAEGLDDGKVAQVQLYGSRTEALKSVGLAH